MIGRVVSVKNKNTATVLVERVATNLLYKKTFVRTKKYLAEDTSSVKEGDLVEIINCRPVSKNKSWKIVKILGKNLAEITEEKLKAVAEKAISEVMPEKEEELNKVEVKENEEGGSKEVKSQKENLLRRSKVKSTSKK